MTLRHLVLPLLLVSLAVPAAADVTIRSKMKSGGFNGLGAFEGTDVRSIQGDKSRNTSDITYSGRMMRMLSGPKDAVVITRVDLDKVWSVVPSKKSYTERSISAQFKDMERTEPAETSGKPAKSEKPEKPDKPTHRVKKTEFTVNKTGGKKTINGFPSDETAVRLTVEVEEIETKQVTTFKSDTNVWATPWTAALRKAVDEETKFFQAYMNKLGVKLSPKDRQAFNPAALAMMMGVDKANAEDTLAQAKKKIESINGFPIVTDSRWYVVEDPRATAARKEAAAKQKDEAADEPAVDLSGGVSGAAGSLFGNMAKKKMRANQEKKEAAREGQPAISTYHEVTAIEFTPVPAGSFDVPAGFKKTDK